VRILSYNVRYFGHALRGLASSRKSRERIAEAIAALEPEIVCLQEASSAENFDTFARALGGRYRALHFPVHVSRLRATALAVLVDGSRFEVAAESVETLTDDGARGERRACACVELRDREGGALHVFNTHLSLPAPLGRTRFGHGANQLAQAQRLHGFVRARAGAQPFILCGDLNSRPASPVVRVFDELTAAAHDGPTAQVGPVKLRLDYLFGGNGVRWLESLGAERFRGLSDHLLLIARFDR
jgi:endonuclease/exonuclease/phosphatase family metal-dependent hydrolase